MDPDLRTGILIGGLIFCGGFAALTISVALDSGVDVFTVVSVVIIGMIASGLFGAIRNPPK